MAMEVDLALNARRFQAGTKDAERALEDLQDVVERFTRDASDAGEQAADGFDDAADAAKDAEREVDDLSDAAKDAEREFKDAADAARDMGRKAEDAGDDARRGMDRASEGAQEFRDEANSTAREAAASFDGSAESIGDAFQEVAANAFAGFGPGGAVAGLAAATGIGLASAGFEAVNEAEQASRERAQEWAQVWVDNGSRVLQATALMGQMREIRDDTERWADVETIAAAAGVEQSLALRALAGDAAAYAQVMDALTAAGEANTAAIADSGDEMTSWALGLQGTRQEIAEATTALQAESDAMQQGQVIADAYTQSLAEIAQTTEGATSTVNEFGDSIYTLPDGAQIIIDAETGQASTDIENVHFQTNQLNGETATVQVNANTQTAENQVLAAVNRMRAQAIMLQATAVVTGRVVRTP